MRLPRELEHEKHLKNDASLQVSLLNFPVLDSVILDALKIFIAVLVPCLPWTLYETHLVKQRKATWHGARG